MKDEITVIRRGQSRQIEDKNTPIRRGRTIEYDESVFAQTPIRWDHS